VYSNGLYTANGLVLGTVPALIRAAPGNLGVDARAFVNAGAGDYHLAANATPIDRGVPLADVMVDRDGLQRPQGAAYDVGAYEFRASSASPPSRP
jgi:hypothetical protein